jgi:hypothetical protein
MLVGKVFLERQHLANMAAPVGVALPQIGFVQVSLPVERKDWGHLFNADIKPALYFFPQLVGLLKEHTGVEAKYLYGQAQLNQPVYQNDAGRTKPGSKNQGFSKLI